MTQNMLEIEKINSKTYSNNLEIMPTTSVIQKGIPFFVAIVTTSVIALTTLRAVGIFFREENPATFDMIDSKVKIALGYILVFQAFICIDIRLEQVMAKLSFRDDDLKPIKLLNHNNKKITPNDDDPEVSTIVNTTSPDAQDAQIIGGNDEVVELG